jgi:hypothetical protein
MLRFESNKSCCNFRREIYENFNEHHGSVKLFTVVRLEKRWTVLVGSELVDVQ